MIEDDNDVNTPGDDNMHVDDSTDDPTWNPIKESLLSEESDGEAWLVAEAEMAEDTFQSKYIKIKSEQNRRMKSELERQPATVPIVNRRLFKIRLNDLLFTEHYRQG